MAPIFWIVGLLVLGVLFWRTMRGNVRHDSRRRDAAATADLEQENLRLRHVLAQLSVENHALKNSLPKYW